MPGVVPGIHDLQRESKQRRGWPGHPGTKCPGARRCGGRAPASCRRAFACDNAGSRAASQQNKFMSHDRSMNVDPQEVLARIDVDELVKVALDLGNIDSPTGREGPVADYVHDWLRRAGFDSRKVALYPDRPNVIATLPGAGEGR